MAQDLLKNPDGNTAEVGGILDDFKYNNNVSSCHIYVRMGFLRKVYGILSVQLLMTAVTAAACAYVPTIHTALMNNPWIFLMCLPFSIAMLIALHLKRHEVPLNFFLLSGFTIIEAITVGIVVSLYEVESVVKALSLTTIITISLTLYTFQSKRDFSKLGTVLFICLIVVFGMGLMNIFVASKGLDLAIAGGAALLFSFFIIYDTHMLMTKLSPEEYILATINLYLDIINLFLELLRIFGQRRN